MEFVRLCLKLCSNPYLGMIIGLIMGTVVIALGLCVLARKKPDGFLAQKASYLCVIGGLIILILTHIYLFIWFIIDKLLEK